ncbi:hypothetical protein BDZ91DRAFT_710238 [Kalaharituber pfeilii]|nr:hypothetical protein BDZ91DRAFT_710238 [Kalaharituber pfeilii]
MRNGAYIRALGRMSFEPNPRPPPQPETATEQQSSSDQAENAPNSENNATTPGQRTPATSRQRTPWADSQADLTAAQNDVLATIGFYLRMNNPKPKEQDATNRLMKENEVGLVVGALDLTAAYLGGWSLLSVRSRVQTFIIYEHARFIDIAKMAFIHRHPLDPFVGMPAHLTFQALSIFTDFVSSRFLVWLVKTKLFKNPKTGKLRKYSVFAMETIDIALQMASWALGLPFYEYSTLQTLYFMPRYPLLPSVQMMKNCWRNFMTTPHIGIFPAWTPNFIVRIFDSYIVLSFIESKIFQMVHSWCFDSLRRILPRPNNPDQASINASLDSEDDFDLEDSETRRRRRRRSGRVRRRRRGGRRSSAIPAQPEQEQEIEGSTTALAGATEHQSDVPTWNDEWIEGLQSEGEIFATSEDQAGPSNAPDSAEGQDLVEELISFEDLQNIPIGTHIPEAAAPAHLPRSSSFLSHISQHHRHRSHSRPRHNHNHDEHFEETGSRSRSSSNRSQHRLTTLSCHPCDAAASHIADAVAAGLTIGMENMVLRSIARQYILRQGRGPNGTAPVALNWERGTMVRLGDVYHPKDYFGGWVVTLKSSMVGYFAAWSLWQATYWASTWLGVGFFGYHRL